MYLDAAFVICDCDLALFSRVGSDNALLSGAWDYLARINQVLMAHRPGFRGTSPDHDLGPTLTCIGSCMGRWWPCPLFLVQYIYRRVAVTLEWLSAIHIYTLHCYCLLSYCTAPGIDVTLCGVLSRGHFPN